MSNDSNIKTLIENLQKRVDFIEKHHEVNFITLKER